MEQQKMVYWNCEGLRVTCLRLLSDAGCPIWSVGYCVGILSGREVRVSLPFDTLPKRGYRRAIVSWAERDGVHAAKIGVLGNISAHG